MKCSSLRSVLSLSLAAAAFAGCAKVNHAIDATNGITGQMNGLKNSVDTTNANMNNTNAKIDETNKQITSTNNAVHNQTLDVAIKDMRDPDNWALLNPGYLLFPAAQVFGKEATVQELMDLTETWKRATEASMEEYSSSSATCVPYLDLGGKMEAVSGAASDADAALAQATDDDAKAAADLAQATDDLAQATTAGDAAKIAAANTALGTAKAAVKTAADAKDAAKNADDRANATLATTNAAFSDGYRDCAADFNRNRLATVAALQAIYGLAPQAKIEEMVKTEIISGGSQMRYAYYALNARYAFLTDVRFENEVKAPMASPSQATPGVVRFGIEVLKNIDYIIGLNVFAQINDFRTSFVPATLEGSANGGPAKYPTVQISAAGTSTGPLWQALADRLANLQDRFPNDIAPLKEEIRAGIQANNVVQATSILK